MLGVSLARDEQVSKAVGVPSSFACCAAGSIALRNVPRPGLPLMSLIAFVPLPLSFLPC